MILNSLHILNYKNIRDIHLSFSDNINCLVGLNGQGKTNILDAIYLLSFTKSLFNVIDSQNISYDEDLALVQGIYTDAEHNQTEITCGLKRGGKKQFRKDRKDYKKLIEHIGLIPLVMVSPEDAGLVEEGSDERRRFLDTVISQIDRQYLENLTVYNKLLKQRNALLRQYESSTDVPTDLFEVLELQMIAPAEYIYESRTRFVNSFIPLFQEIYHQICGGQENVSLRYISQLQDRNLSDAFARTRQRDLILGWTSQGIHKDELEMLLEGHPLKRVGSQGQQKTYILSMKLAQAAYLTQQQPPILLLDDIFDKLDSERVERIVQLVRSNRFGQIFITDTDRQHLTSILKEMEDTARIFHVSNGEVSPA